ncbi:YjcZ family sporulation protein [Bacillus methanolicus]|nr:YjcZ family sporulation protein [Bacillus methanolicus]
MVGFGSYCGFGFNFALIIVLFILLIIVGTSIPKETYLD